MVDLTNCARLSLEGVANTDEIIGWFAQELEMPEDRVIGVIKINMLTNILYEIQMEKINREYSRAETKAERDELLTESLEAWP